MCSTRFLGMKMQAISCNNCFLYLLCATNTTPSSWVCYFLIQGENPLLFYACLVDAAFDLRNAILLWQLRARFLIFKNKHLNELIASNSITQQPSTKVVSGSRRLKLCVVIAYISVTHSLRHPGNGDYKHQFYTMLLMVSTFAKDTETHLIVHLADRYKYSWMRSIRRSRKRNHKIRVIRNFSTMLRSLSNCWRSFLPIG